VTSLWAYRLLDGTYNDYLAEESVDLLLRASWFKHQGTLRTPSTQGGGGPLLSGYVPDGWTDEEYHAYLQAHFSESALEAERDHDSAYDDEWEDEELMRRVGSRLGSRALCNRAFGVGGFIANGRRQAREGRRTHGQGKASAEKKKSSAAGASAAHHASAATARKASAQATGAAGASSVHAAAPSSWISPPPAKCAASSSGPECDQECAPSTAARKAPAVNAARPIAIPAGGKGAGAAPAASPPLPDEALLVSSLAEARCADAPCHLQGGRHAGSKAQRQGSEGPGCAGAGCGPAAPRGAGAGPCSLRGRGDTGSPPGQGECHGHGQGHGADEGLDPARLGASPCGSDGAADVLLWGAHTPSARGRRSAKRQARQQRKLAQQQHKAATRAALLAFRVEPSAAAHASHEEHGLEPASRASEVHGDHPTQEELAMDPDLAEALRRSLLDVA